MSNRQFRYLVRLTLGKIHRDNLGRFKSDSIEESVGRDDG